ncbi:hypothetical protein BMYO_1296 [Bifidobacterium myosotis]|uniref:Uncharacterized protein n=1 Tax=Bifidobacterium myosotis TaxID=1630166 RepID=A0A261FJV8_9BIFI|nr:hypothetical protein BMYO_1296 [Bifidobacterium myosotis]
MKPVTEMPAAGWSATETAIDSAMSESPMMAEAYEPSVFCFNVCSTGLAVFFRSVG